jgi:uncharacterized protein YijF (DUF1287 family)
MASYRARDRKEARAQQRLDRRASKAERAVRRAKWAARASTLDATHAAPKSPLMLMARSDASAGSMAQRYQQWRTVGAWLLPLFLLSAYASLPSYPDADRAPVQVAEPSTATPASVPTVVAAVPLAIAPPVDAQQSNEPRADTQPDSVQATTQIPAGPLVSGPLVSGPMSRKLLAQRADRMTRLSERPKSSIVPQTLPEIPEAQVAAHISGPTFADVQTPAVAVAAPDMASPDFAPPAAPVVIARLADELIVPATAPAPASIPAPAPIAISPPVVTVTPTIPTVAVAVPAVAAQTMPAVTADGEINTAICSAPPLAAWQRASLRPRDKLGDKSASKGIDARTAGLLPPGLPRPDNDPKSPPKTLGLRISEAALTQINELVIYRAAYSRIAYPMGDVSPLFGVCTDVVIRALRDVGIDLQEQVQVTRSGNGDTNIDHRRVETLKKYFARHGATLAISEFAEDYRPGDIVTYFRPWNRSTTTHIAIVSHMIAPSGRPMIVHNRGWGAQLEDALLVDRITGHFRVATTPALTTSALPAKATPNKVAAQSTPASVKR